MNISFGPTEIAKMDHDASQPAFVTCCAVKVDFALKYFKDY